MQVGWWIRSWRSGEYFTHPSPRHTFLRQCSRYWYLPAAAFGWVEWFESRLFPDYDAVSSMDKVDVFVAGTVDDTRDDKDRQTYQARLLQAGLTISETRAQCKDLIVSSSLFKAAACFL